MWSRQLLTSTWQTTTHTFSWDSWEFLVKVPAQRELVASNCVNRRYGGPTILGQRQVISYKSKDRYSPAVLVQTKSF